MRDYYKPKPKKFYIFGWLINLLGIRAFDKLKPIISRMEFRYLPFKRKRNKYTKKKNTKKPKPPNPLENYNPKIWLYRFISKKLDEIEVQSDGENSIDTLIQGFQDEIFKITGESINLSYKYGKVASELKLNSIQKRNLEYGFDFGNEFIQLKNVLKTKHEFPIFQSDKDGNILPEFLDSKGDFKFYARLTLKPNDILIFKVPLQFYFGLAKYMLVRLNLVPEDLKEEIVSKDSIFSDFIEDDEDVNENVFEDKEKIERKEKPIISEFDKEDKEIEKYRGKIMFHIKNIQSIDKLKEILGVIGV